MKHKEEGKILGASKVGEKGQIVIPKDIEIFLILSQETVCFYLRILIEELR